jgi:hypothetical protein
MDVGDDKGPLPPIEDGLMSCAKTLRHTPYDTSSGEATKRQQGGTAAATPNHSDFVLGRRYPTRRVPDQRSSCRVSGVGINRFFLLVCELYALTDRWLFRQRQSVDFDNTNG